MRHWARLVRIGVRDLDRAGARAPVALVCCCLLLVACRASAPPPSGTVRVRVPPPPGSVRVRVPPPSPAQQSFTSALFSIYRAAQRAVDGGDDHTELSPLEAAASTVRDGAARFGDIARVLAITQLAAPDVARRDFKGAIATLAQYQSAPEILHELLARHPRAELAERERIVYDFLVGPETFLTLSPTSQPDCPSTYPSVSVTHQFGVATATVTAFVQKPLDDLAANMDPQNWDNPCGALLFHATYLTDLKANGTFDVDANYDALPGATEPEGQTWGPRYLFEYVLPGAGSNFFKTLLSVKTVRTSDSYKVENYELTQSLRTQIFPDPATEGGLFEDSGYASATPTDSVWTLLQGSKRIRFNTRLFPSHPGDQLADDTATTLKMMATGFTYWACCPR